MKYYLIIPMALCFMFCKGQEYKDLVGRTVFYDSVQFEKYHQIGTSKEGNGNHVYDTVLVTAQISDTTSTTSGLVSIINDTIHYPVEKYYNHSVYWEYIYSVREKHNTIEGVFDPYIYQGAEYHDYWQHIKYLTQDKKTLPKTIIVWQSIEANTPPKTK